MNELVIIDYGAGNVESVKYAFDRLGQKAVLSDDPEIIQNAGKVVFPGVGHARPAMEKLAQNGLDKVIGELKQPVLGICLGMQLMCSNTEEGNTKGLGIFPVSVKKFDNGLKVPQIGWNSLCKLKSKLFRNVDDEPYLYFVHSYYVPVNEYCIASSTYGIEFSAALMKDNFYGCQFHPEKSGPIGQAILKNFLEL